MLRLHRSIRRGIYFPAEDDTKNCSSRVGEGQEWVTLEGQTKNFPDKRFLGIFRYLIELLLYCLLTKFTTAWLRKWRQKLLLHPISVNRWRVTSFIRKVSPIFLAAQSAISRKFTCTSSWGNFLLVYCQWKSSIPAGCFCDVDSCRCSESSADSIRWLFSCHRRCRSDGRCVQDVVLAGSDLREEAVLFSHAASSFPCSSHALLVGVAVQRAGWPIELRFRLHLTAWDGKILGFEKTILL